MGFPDPSLTGLRILGSLFVYYMQATMTKASQMNGSDALLNTTIPSTIDVSQTPMIYGGYPAKQEDTKHLVSIRYVPWEERSGFGRGHLCGGSLIRWNIVLSAAHCFYAKNADNLLVVMGNVNRFNKTDTLSLGIERVAMYPEFEMVTIRNDIALAFLRGSVPEDSQHVSPIAISPKQFGNYERCQLTGWGKTENNDSTGALLACNVAILTLSTCKESTQIPSSHLFTGMMCAGVEMSGIGACFGDSGGPMVCQRQLIGIVSWLYGEQCAVVCRPTVLTELYCYQDWIDHEINGDWSEDSRRHVKLRLAQCSGSKRLTSTSLIVGLIMHRSFKFSAKILQ